MKRTINFISISLFIVFFASLSVLAESKVNLKEILYTEGKDKATLTFLCSDNFEYRAMSLSDPERLVIDFDSVNLKTQLPARENKFFKKVRSSDHDHHFLRLVFDLNNKIKFRSQLHSANHALSLELAQTENSKNINTTALDKKLPMPLFEKETKEPVEEVFKKPHEEIAKAPKQEASEEPTMQVDDNHKTKNIMIVIDPGHGGKDPGAAGLNGAREKDVVLRISKELCTMLNQEPGFKAVLTRDRDIYIPLRQRLAIARKNHADMFIAIHADAYNHTQATGASVYALSQRGATSEAAKWLAEKENESELGGLSSELADKDEMLRSVLIDLSQTHTIESSLKIGNNVLRHLGTFSRLHHPRVEQAAFVVLKSPDIPSILVETGFLSNPLEEEKLTDPTYQYHTAEAIKEGIKKYFMTYSPSGTWFAENRKKYSGD